MVVQQIRFRDLYGEPSISVGGILINDEYIICGCCGGIFENDKEEIEILEKYDDWVDLDYMIKGE